MSENRFSKQNLIQIRVNRFNNPTFKTKKYLGFSFNDNLKSVNLNELEFTNYVKSRNCKKYLDLKRICIKLEKDKNELYKLFEADELDSNTSVIKYERLLKILSIVNNREIQKEEIILKFKNKNDKEIQFYIKDENGIFMLYLIDIYHIGIEAKNKKNGRTDRKGIYRARSCFKFDIKEIQNDLKYVF